MKNGIFVIDADGHLLEPAAELKLEKPFETQGPTQVTDPHTGKPKLLFAGRLWTKDGRGQQNPGIAPTPGQAGVERPTDAAARIADMDREGIDVAYLFPTSVTSMIRHAEGPLSTALCRAYNNWVADWVKPYADRLKPVGAMPFPAPDEAVMELRRCVEKLGMRAVWVPTNVYGRNLDSPLYYPFYAEAERLGAVVMCHANAGGYETGAECGSERFENFFCTHMVSMPFEMMLTAVALITGGVCDQFPRLHFALLETGAGWVPYWFERMEEHYHKIAYLVPGMRRKPDEYLEQLFISCDPGEETLPHVLEVAEDSIIFASDYPHWDGEYPRAVAKIADRRTLTDTQKRKVLGENAKRMFHVN
ncbi:MAG: amidohydrolase [Deltaproteobacteria bacterium]|nr:amidohydrolase [Deltaproteobacteria bacterium]